MIGSAYHNTHIDPIPSAIDYSTSTVPNDMLQSYIPTTTSTGLVQDYVPATAFSDGIETLITPLGRQQHSQYQPNVGSGFFPGGFEGWNHMSVPSEHFSYLPPSIQHPIEFALPSPIQTALAFPIAGIGNDIQKKMFYHFRDVMANLLTTMNGAPNPMNDVFIPLAMQDPTIMDILLGLSGSHLLKLQDTNSDPRLEQEKQRLHSRASQVQERRTSYLLSSDPRQRVANSSQNQEKIFATSLLLCLYEICEGSSDNSSQKHLDMARQIISVPHNGARDQLVATKVNPFLIEFFLYHICLAMVTMPSFLHNQDFILRLTELLGNDMSLVSVIKMLLYFINRIALLRAEVHKNETTYSSILTKALPIYDELAAWKPHLELSQDQKDLADFYQKALSIWLFSVVNPDKKSDRQIQALVQEITAKMNNINDNVKACLLFPLFMVGGAAITQEDRSAVTVLFKKLRDWSSLGNIDVAFAVVENMWKDYDNNVPRAWDWTTQLERKRMGLLVT